MTRTCAFPSHDLESEHFVVVVIIVFPLYHYRQHQHRWRYYAADSQAVPLQSDTRRQAKRQTHQATPSRNIRSLQCSGFTLRYFGTSRSLTVPRSSILFCSVIINLHFQSQTVPLCSTYTYITSDRSPSSLSSVCSTRRPQGKELRRRKLFFLCNFAFAYRCICCYRPIYLARHSTCLPSASSLLLSHIDIDADIVLNVNVDVSAAAIALSSRARHPIHRHRS